MCEEENGRLQELHTVGQANVPGSCRGDLGSYWQSVRESGLCFVQQIIIIPVFCVGSKQKKKGMALLPVESRFLHSCLSSFQALPNLLIPGYG